MFAKIQITGKLIVKSGLHIGGNTAFSAIGAVDSPVIRDVISNVPFIPGSSLKGKMRSLLAKAYNEELKGNADGDCLEICALFGKSAQKKDNKNNTGRIIFSDLFLSNYDDLRKRGVNSITEVKTENSINRLTAVANPRQIERVIRGAEFELNLMYEYDEKHYEKDIELITTGLKLLKIDYLGGNGTRGYGKVDFSDFEVMHVYGDNGEKVQDAISRLKEGVTNL